MAYGDTGINGAARGPFADNIPWTEGEIIGTDDTGAKVSRPKKMVPDTGSLFTTVDAQNAKGLQIVAQGVVKLGVIAGAALVGFFKGLTFKFQAVKAGANVDVEYTGRFGITPVPAAAPAPVVMPPLLGTDLFIDRAVIVTVDFAAKTVKLAQ